MTTSTMAATVFSFGLKTQFPHNTIRSAKIPFTKPSIINKQKLSLKLSSSNSICGIRPLVLSKKITVASPVQRDSRQLTVVCAKGYKRKTHKASAKRFRVTGSGKIVRRRAGKQHLLRKKNTKRRVRLSKMLQVDRSDYNNVIGALPYLKVNRSN
ncbi:60S ribosomal protein L35 [Castilleja foliolosa]|uniref:50S ribosomal protein L35 n=1 Tax=Castilleja foliolosa TaxID=1961234 RepID=A0ABD3C2E8_9LAMI